MSFEDEVNDLLEIQIGSWRFGGTELCPNAEASVYFSHTPSENRPNGLPISFEDVEKLDEKYGVCGITSISSGRNGSRLVITLEDI